MGKDGDLMAERHERRLVDRLSGTGSLSRAGATLGPVDYYIDIWQDFLIVPGHEDVGALRELQIRLTYDFDISGLLGETLTLHPADGRHVEGSLDGSRFLPSSELT